MAKGMHRQGLGHSRVTCVIHYLHSSFVSATLFVNSITFPSHHIFCSIICWHVLSLPTLSLVIITVGLFDIPFLGLLQHHLSAAIYLHAFYFMHCHNVLFLIPPYAGLHGSHDPWHHMSTASNIHRLSIYLVFTPWFKYCSMIIFYFRNFCSIKSSQLYLSAAYLVCGFSTRLNL